MTDVKKKKKSKPCLAEILNISSSWERNIPGKSLSFFLNFERWKRCAVCYVLYQSVWHG